MTSEDRHLNAMYRDASRETSPEHCDRAILERARRTAPRSWRGFAVAATVLLSFAFILNTGVLQPGLPNDPAALIVDDSVQENTVDLPRPSERMESRAQSTGSASFDAAPQVAGDSRREVMAESPPSAASAPATARLLEQMQEKNLDSSPVSAFSDDARRPERRQQERYCTDAVSASPGSWHRCIIELREDGQEDKADIEQALLLTRFPDFEIR